MRSSPAHRLTLPPLAAYAAALAAVLVPTQLAINIPPSVTVVNQLAAFIGWGLLLMAAGRIDPRRTRAVTALGVVVVLLLGATAGSMAFAGLPVGLALSFGLTVACAWSIANVAASLDVDAALRPVAWALVASGLLGTAIGIVQVYVPAWTEAAWIASTTLPGRAVGNLRQPNHLATLLLWAVVAATYLSQPAPARPSPSPAPRWVWMLPIAVLLLGLALTGSRTGAVGLAVLVLWGLLDRRLARRSRALLVASPLVYAAWLLAVAALPPEGAAVDATARFERPDLSGARFAIWSDTLQLIRAHPLAGVGVGEFNLAWTMTALPQRPQQFFDHSHDLPLQLLVELGLPLGLLVLALLFAAFVQAFVAARRAQGADALAVRSAFAMLVVVGLHSLLEYPLWYAYFLFPAAYVWGLCLGSPAAAPPAAAAATPRAAAASAAGLGIGAALVAAGLYAASDYARVSAVFSPDADGRSLPARIDDGRRSLLFGHHADYALVTTFDEPPGPLSAFERPVHYLLDARLMIAWSRALAAAGDVDRARWVAARLREFDHAGADAFFEPCASTSNAAQTSRPFQCEPPLRLYTVDDFR